MEESISTQLQHGHSPSALQRLLRAGYPIAAWCEQAIEAYRVNCGEFSDLGPRERAGFGESPCILKSGAWRTLTQAKG